MVEPAKTGLVDLERELTCSICTEVLYQPLTLLDCLHTFCGSCLKEWFSWQVSQASTSKPNPFTCPSCRASVRDTRPNAGITTLLDMYLQANPSKGKGDQEKEEIKRRYSPGENVLPKVRRRKERNDEMEDRRMMEEIREMSLRDVGIRGSGSYERGTRHRARDRARDAQDGGIQLRSQGAGSARSPNDTDAASRERQIGHQSSLRSLLSSSDLDSSEMEEEILRQIMDEGILDGIDLNNVDVSQEDELSERIAEAYRRRHDQRSMSRQVRTEEPRANSSSEHRSAQDRQHHRPGRSPNPTGRTTHSSHPPVSRPHLLEAYPTDHGHRRRTSSETRRHTSPASGRRPSSATERPAARSATDLTTESSMSSSRRTHPSDLPISGRRTTDPESLQPRTISNCSGTSSPRSPAFRLRGNTTHSDAQANAVSNDSAQDHPMLPVSRSISTASGSPQRPDSSAQAGNLGQSYTEPSISCERCGKQNIQYEVHWNCSECREGRYNLCLRCYRTELGCLHWFGFGYSAMRKYKTQEAQQAFPPNYPLPHHLEARCYLRSPVSNGQSTTPNPNSPERNPDERLQSGPFCSNCLEYTPNCYWKCDICNEGEWGFCNDCVNRSRCCTHALLPFRYIKSPVPHASSHSESPGLSGPTPNHQDPLSAIRATSMDQAFEKNYAPLSLSTKCAICTYPIPPSTTRFHCLQCNDGDYDIDAACYNKLVSKKRISIDNGPQGWRHCLQGHHMIVIGFEDSNSGQRRVIVADLVGGHALEDESKWSWQEGQQKQIKVISGKFTKHTEVISPGPSDDATPPLLKRYPPSGGQGLRMKALWSWWPLESDHKALAFPKGAEIRECKVINQEWSWGVYCSRKGVFPSNHCRVVGEKSI